MNMVKSLMQQPFGRIFTLTPSGSSAYVVRSTPIKSEDTSYDRWVEMTLKEVTIGEIPAWEFQIREASRVLKGLHRTRDEAFDGLIDRFYDRLTEFKFNKAKTFAEDKEVLVRGAWLSSDSQIPDYCTIVTEAHNDERDNAIFVIDFPGFVDYTTVKLTPTSFKNGMFKFRNGTKIPEMYCRNYNIERYISGEVRCPLCKCTGTLESMWMRYVWSLGPCCGICFDMTDDKGYEVLDQTDYQDVQP